MPFRLHTITKYRLFRKNSLRRAAFPVILALIAVSSFGLGRLSALESERPHLIIHPPGDEAAVASPVSSWPPPQSTSTTDVARNFVASKNGAKYYPASCASANRISDANKIWFATEQDAVAAGYDRTANCNF